MNNKNKARRKVTGTEKKASRAAAIGTARSAPPPPSVAGSDADVAYAWGCVLTFGLRSFQFKLHQKASPCLNTPPCSLQAARTPIVWPTRRRGASQKPSLPAGSRGPWASARVTHLCPALPCPVLSSCPGWGHVSTGQAGLVHPHPARCEPGAWDNSSPHAFVVEGAAFAKAEAQKGRPRWGVRTLWALVREVCR